MAVDYYMTIDRQQGPIKGDGFRSGHQNKIRLLSARSRVAVPRDAGAVGGQGVRRKHENIVVRKRVGGATPRILAAMCAGEVLPSVLIEYINLDEGGKDNIGLSIRLTDATICGHTIDCPEVHGGELPVEEIEFSARKITWESKGPDGTVKATDDWGS